MLQYTIQPVAECDVSKSDVKRLVLIFNDNESGNDNDNESAADERAKWKHFISHLLTREGRE